MYRVPQSPSPCGKVMLQCGTVSVCSGEGNQHAARNGKEATAGCILFSVSGEGGLCSYQETGRGKSSGTAHLQSKPISMGSRGAWERKLQVEAALGSFVLWHWPCSDQLVTSTAVRGGLELLLFIASYCSCKALKECQASKIRCCCIFNILFNLVCLKILIKPSSKYYNLQETINPHSSADEHHSCCLWQSIKQEYKVQLALWDVPILLQGHFLDSGFY